MTSETLAARRVSPVVLALTVAASATLWLLDLEGFHTPVLTSFHGQRPLTPLYAFWMPVVRVQALAFVAAAAALVLSAGRLVDPTRVGRGTFVGALLAAAVGLPLALFAVRQEVGTLGTQFLIYPGEEFYYDAARIPALGPFLREYVTLMPQLSLHGQHFPPGHAILLYAVRRLYGPSPLAAGIAVLACFAAAIPLAYVALARLGGERGARQGALLLLACPSLLDFACTSMDAVFLLVATLAWWLVLRAGSLEGGILDALLAGAALLGATFFSFSAFPLALAAGLFTLLAGRRAPRRAARQLCGIGIGYGAGALVLWALTGFAIWTCTLAARQRGLALMTQIVGGSPFALHWKTSYGNAVAFVIGTGLALVPAAASRLRAGGLGADPWTVSALGTLAVMAAGGLYFMETERIWLYAMPWLAAMVVSRGPLSENSVRMLLAAGLAQALAMEVALFTLW